MANQTPHLKAAFLEASFPDSMTWLAEQTGHLTTSMFRDEVAKINHKVDVIAVHIKPLFEMEIVAELKELGIPRLQIGKPGERYEF